MARKSTSSRKTNNPGAPEIDRDSEQARVTLVHHSLLETSYQKRWRRGGGVFQLLNSCLLLLNRSLIVTFYELRDGRFHYTWSSLNDRALMESFRSSHWKKLHDAEGRLLCEHHRLTHQIFETDIYYVLWAVDMSAANQVTMTVRPLGVDAKDKRQAKDDQAIVNLIAKTLSGSREEQSALAAVITRDDAELRAGENAATVATVLKDKEEGIDLKAGAAPTTNQDEHMRGTPAELDRALIVAERALYAIRKVLGSVYNVYSGSPLLKNATANDTPNMLFFWKVVARRPLSPRCGVYPHDALLIIPEDQRSSLAEAIKNRRSELIQALHHHAGKLPNGSRKIEGDAYRNVAKMLERIDATGAHILAAAQGYRDVNLQHLRKMPEMAKCERLFNEYTLSSGVVNFRERPLDPGRLTTVDSTLGDDIDAKWAYERSACLWSILWLMAPPHSSPRRDLVALQVPIRVGGASAGCLVTLRTETDAANPIIDDKAFHYSFHFYHSLAKHMVRRIRTKLRSAYYDLLGEILVEHLVALVQQAKSNGVPIVTSSFLAAINADFKTIGRVIPYKTIALRRGVDGSKMKDNAPIYILRDPRWPVFVELEDNVIFDRTGDDTYVELADIKQRLETAMLRFELSPTYINYCRDHALLDRHPGP